MTIICCWKCGDKSSDFTRGKVPFRELCEKCSSWLHCCRNCRNYKPGMPNNCLIPGTELISDREAFNFCEEFQPLGKSSSPAANLTDITRRLFGEDTLPPKNDDPKSKFNDLFGE